LIINGVVLTVCAVFDFAWFDFTGADYISRTTVLTALMLFLPLFDRTWSLPRLNINKSKLFLWLMLLVAGLTLVALNSDYANYAVSTVLFAALPEEWFFRAYFMQRLGQILRGTQCLFIKQKIMGGKIPGYLPANILTSTLFASLHMPTQGWVGLSVFFPSLFYGWVYQKTRDLILVILLHALSNIIFIIYLAEHMQGH